MIKKGKIRLVIGCIGFSILFSVLTLSWSEFHSSSSSIHWFEDDSGEAGNFIGKAIGDEDDYTGRGEARELLDKTIQLGGVAVKTYALEEPSSMATSKSLLTGVKIDWTKGTYAQVHSSKLSGFVRFI